ncbi:class I SAM-dependent methyltransferase [Dactylosporangium cerinum]
MTDTVTDAGTDTGTMDLTERLLGQLLAGTELFSVHLGIQLGLYRVLHEHPGATDAVLAERAGIDRRYAREWLEQQAAAGYLQCTSLAERTFRLPDGAADVLLDPAHPASGVGLVTVFAGVAQALPALAEAYRTGGGVPYAAYGSFTRDGIAAMNLPGFRHSLAQEWLPALPDVVERLTKAPARVMDLGCGAGASTLALAEAFPRAAVTGVDLDEESIADARRAAAAALADRVTFLRQDAAAAEGDYALVTIFEALHDMGDPVGVLRTVRGCSRPVVCCSSRTRRSPTSSPRRPMRSSGCSTPSACCTACRRRWPSIRWRRPGPRCGRRRWPGGRRRPDSPARCCRSSTTSGASTGCPFWTESSVDGRWIRVA